MSLGSGSHQTGFVSSHPSSIIPFTALWRRSCASPQSWTVVHSHTEDRLTQLHGISFVLPQSCLLYSIGKEPKELQSKYPGLHSYFREGELSFAFVRA